MRDWHDCNEYAGLIDSYFKDNGMFVATYECERCDKRWWYESDGR